MGDKAKKSFIINVIFIGLWAGIILVTGRFLLKYMLPFIIAVTVAAVMQRPATIISKKIHIKKGVCAALISAVLYLILALCLLLAFFKIFSFTGTALASISDMGNTVAEIYRRIETAISEILIGISPEFKATAGKIFSAVTESVIERLSVFLSSTAAKIVTSAPSFLFSSIVALAATCYIAKDFDGLCVFLKKLMGAKTVSVIGEIKGILKSSVLKIVTGYLILMIITFLELIFGLLILGVENWLLIAFTIAVIDALPVLGAGAVLLPWGIVNIVLGNSFLGIGLMLLYLLITIIRNFAEPKIVGSKTGINPLFILLTMFLGLKLFGFVGLVILPVTFIVVIKYYKNEMELESSPE